MEVGRWKCLPIADSRNNGPRPGRHIHGGCILYVAQGEPRSNQTECQKSKSKVRKQKPKQKSQSRWPKQKAARKTFRHTKAAARKGTREKQTFGAACLSGKYPGTRRNSFSTSKMKEEEGRGKVLPRLRCSQVVVRRVWWAHQKDANVQYEGLAQHAGGMEESKELCQCCGSRTWARLGEKSSTKKGQEMKA